MLSSRWAGCVLMLFAILVLSASVLEHRYLHGLGEELLAGDPVHGYHRVLALRLLRSMLGVTSYSELLTSMDHRLRSSIEPADVVAFMRQCAGVEPTEHCMFVRSLDELNAARPAPSMWVRHLLSAFVGIITSPDLSHASSEGQRPASAAAGNCGMHRASTLPVCMLASTRWSSTLLAGTASGAAGILDLHMLPFTVKDGQEVYLDLCPLQSAGNHHSGDAANGA